MKAPADLRAALRRYLVEELIFGQPAPEFRDSDDLFEVGLDSMAILRTTTFLEERLGRTLPDRALKPEHFRSIDALVQFVASLPESRASAP